MSPHACSSEGREVRTLTRRPAHREPFRGPHRGVPARLRPQHAGRAPPRRRHPLQHVLDPLHLDRKPHVRAAVENSITLLEAARTAGVRRVVQLERLERRPVVAATRTSAGRRSPRQLSLAPGSPTRSCAPRSSSHGTRSCVNNIAWLLRRLPLFVVPGSGRLHPPTGRRRGRCRASRRGGGSGTRADGHRRRRPGHLLLRRVRASRPGDSRLARGHRARQALGVALGLSALTGPIRARHS